MNVAPRALPLVDKDTHAFWTRGARGELAIFRCQNCGYYVHPPVQFCPRCTSRSVEPEVVSGRGVVASYTINYKQWVPDLPTPYVLALVELAEQADVRLATNIVNCPPESVYIGMPVRVLFEVAEELWIPLFEPSERR